MNDAQQSQIIRLPLGFPSDQSAVTAEGPQNDEQFARHQLEFIRQLFGRSEYLRMHGGTTHVSDAFLSMFITLLDVLIANAPSEAQQCATQLRRVLDVVLPDGTPGESG